MKALFQRFHRSSLKDKDGTAQATARDAADVATKEKATAVIPVLPPLPEWPPRKPADRERPLPPIAAQEDDAKAREGRRGPSGSSNGDVQKKVAFLSPPSTPGPNGPGLDASLVDSATQRKASAPADPSSKSVAPTHAAGPISTVSKTNLNQSNLPPKAGPLSLSKSTVTRMPTTPPSNQRIFSIDNASSVRTGTPFSTNSVNTSRILSTASWSEAAEEDLVSNLGPRERTRQEVLWEIVASEERYVTELLKLKHTFIAPLLHPFATSPIGSPDTFEVEEYDHQRLDTSSPQESLEHLPIAARFLSPSPFLQNESSASPGQGSSTPVIDGDSIDSDEEGDQLGKAYGGRAAAAARLAHPRSPYRSRQQQSTQSSRGKTMPFPSRSHHSLPPPPRPTVEHGSSASLGRQSYIGPSPVEEEKVAGQTSSTNRVFRKLRKSQSNHQARDVAVPPQSLPPDLKRCLEVLEGGILGGHLILAEGLRKRYDEQYPLVRSLADVFVTNSHILRDYSTYVLHLERALEQVDDALSTTNATKKPKKQDSADWILVSKLLHRLEESADEKGETGLAISLSKPFQRLLKYPLLFQNLLFHTDPSTFEYESTLQMVAEVESIVRSIEDEKIQKEERDRTRDAFARIDGLDKVRQLAAPKPSRLLVEEKMLSTTLTGRDSSGSPAPGSKSSSPPPSATGKGVKGKSSFRRLSDVLQPGGSSSMGGRKDLWLVVFNDVVLRCQRTGTTSLPLASTGSSTGTGPRNNSHSELSGKGKYNTNSRRNSQTKPRNLYKFIKIETWAMTADPGKPIVSMEDISRSRALVPSTTDVPPELNADDDLVNDSDDSDKKSKMSFSYWGADKVTLSNPSSGKPRAIGSAGRTRARAGASAPPRSFQTRQSSANAKFGTRLVHTAESTSVSGRSSSRRQVAPKRAFASEDAKATTTSIKPPWDGSTRAAAAASAATSATSATSSTGARRPRNLSHSSSQPSRAAKLASPAPSEDSGVGLYRQMMAQDPSLTR